MARPTILCMAFASLLAVAVPACGSAPKKAPEGAPKPRPSASASVAVQPPPRDLPPLSPMPPPGALGSTSGKVRSDQALFTCLDGTSAKTPNPTEAINAFGERCKAASRMRTLGAPIRMQQADKDAHQEHAFHAEAGKCYRVYFATDSAITDTTVVLRDKAGAVVATSAGRALPEDGVACFTRDDDVTVLIGVGSGKGSWALQVWEGS